MNPKPFSAFQRYIRIRRQQSPVAARGVMQEVEQRQYLHGPKFASLFNLFDFGGSFFNGNIFGARALRAKFVIKGYFRSGDEASSTRCVARVAENTADQLAFVWEDEREEELACRKGYHRAQ